MKKVYLHLFYILLIVLVMLSKCNKSSLFESIFCSDTIITVDTIRIDTIRYKSDTLYRYKIDTLSLRDTLKMRDTVYILKDWATPKVFINEYSDSNYTLTVTDSINFNKLISQRIQLDIVTGKSSGKGSLWLNYQTPLTVGASYQRERLGVGIGYDIIDGSIITGVSFRVW